MKRIITAIKGKFSQPEVPVADDRSSDTVSVEPDNLVNNDCGVEMSLDAEMHGRIESQGPGKNVLMPDIYGNEHEATVPDLKIFDPSSTDAVGEAAELPFHLSGRVNKDKGLRRFRRSPFAFSRLN